MYNREIEDKGAFARVYYDGYGDSGFDVMRLPGFLSDEQAMAMWGAVLPTHSNSCYCSHDCCAHRFNSDPHITRTNTRILIKQSWGYNV